MSGFCSPSNPQDLIDQGKQIFDEHVNKWYLGQETSSKLALASDAEPIDFSEPQFPLL